MSSGVERASQKLVVPTTAQGLRVDQNGYETAAAGYHSKKAAILRPSNKKDQKPGEKVIESRTPGQKSRGRWKMVWTDSIKTWTAKHLRNFEFRHVITHALARRRGSRKES